MTRETIRNDVFELVGQRRFAHVSATEEECRRLAELFSLSPEDTEKLATAALLHDITKYFTVEQHLALMASLGEPVPDAFLQSEKTLHALTGAYYARQRYPDLVDETVFLAIRYHTTGRANMTLPEKLLCMADFIEPTRTFPDCVAKRQYFYDRAGADPLRALNGTLLLSFDTTIFELTRLRCPIHPDTVAARDFLVAQEER